MSLTTVRLGVVGYCPPTEFDEDEAKTLIARVFSELEQLYRGCEIVIVSGYANLGIPGLAYAEASQRRWRTAGVVCRRRANKYPLFPVDEPMVIEDEARESEEFLGRIDALLRFGGGEQSIREAVAAKALSMPVWEYEITTTR